MAMGSNLPFLGENLEYYHWFLTDRSYILEFGGDENNIFNSRIIVHRRKITTTRLKLSELDFTHAARTRAKRIIGGTGYSFLLRNSEHVNTYITLGIWRSLETIEDGEIMKYFKSYVSDDVRRILNILPLELQNIFQPDLVTPRNPEVQPLFQYKETKLTCNAEKAHQNILILGPTGTGKSDLINLMFNRRVVESRASISSVTQQVQFISGTYNQNILITIADTIGLCDTVLTTAQVHSLIKQSIKYNLVRIHKVIFVLPERIPGPEAISCKGIIEMLDLKNHSHRLMFLINRTGTRSDEDKLALVTGIGPVLDYYTVNIVSKGSNNKKKRVQIIHCVDTQAKESECLNIISEFIERDNNIKVIEPDSKSCIIL